MSWAVSCLLLPQNPPFLVGKCACLERGKGDKRLRVGSAPSGYRGGALYSGEATNCGDVKG